MRLAIVFSSIAAALAGLLCAFGAPNDAVRQPVIVELFTSEGCSSCPPADVFLKTLDESQPVPGALVIALSEHVDYWDGLGWKDPFSSALFSRRQEAYAQRFHLDGVYTPQAVVDGTFEAVGSDSGKILAAIRKSAAVKKIGVRISPVVNNSSGAPAVHVEVDDAERGARLMIALADDTAITQVLRGENGGRKLTHVAVVRRLTDFGPAARSVDVPLTGEWREWSGRRFVAFLQDRQNGAVRGAAIRLLTPAALK